MQDKGKTRLHFSSQKQPGGTFCPPVRRGGGGLPDLKGVTALGCPPLGLLGKGRDRGQGRLVEGERGRERERDRQRPPSETMMLYLALKRSVTLNREVTSKALD